LKHTVSASLITSCARYSGDGHPLEAHAFSAPLIKIARARKHLAELEQQIEVYLSTEPARFTSASPLHLHIVLPPEHLGAIIGDVVHNLRAALDLVACEMIRAVEGEDANVDEVSFPFCRRVDDLEGIIRRRQFHRAGEQAVQVLRGLNPYRDGNAASTQSTVSTFKINTCLSFLPRQRYLAVWCTHGMLTESLGSP
jgi:hypothetical protein